jgi:UDP-glucose:(heptosyl)LPS alpha-1,3-glucosyltransferase
LAEGQPLRIALVVERFARAGGGVECVAWQLAQRLARRGDDVHVIARACEEPAAGETSDDRNAGRCGRPTVHRVEAPAPLRSLRMLEFSRRARQIVEAQRFDAVHGFARVQAQDVFHAGLGCHAAYLQAVHGDLGRALRRLSPRHAVQLQLEAQLARRPDVLIQCVSEAVARSFREHYDVPDDRLCSIPNGVDLDHFSIDGDGDGADDGRREALRASLAPGADAVWLFVGSGFHRKGLDVAIDALGRSRIERSVLWVVGRDRASRWRRHAARRGVGDRVRFLGERNDVARLLRACDGLVLPTRYEPGGLVVLEAAASGRPVVTSSACGHAELLGDAALVVEDPEDAAAFAAALDRLDEAGLRRELGRSARQRVEAYGWDRVVEALRAQYVEIARRRGAKP